MAARTRISSPPERPSTESMTGPASMRSAYGNGQGTCKRLANQCEVLGLRQSLVDPWPTDRGVDGAGPGSRARVGSELERRRGGRGAGSRAERTWQDQDDQGPTELKTRQRLRSFRSPQVLKCFVEAICLLGYGSEIAAVIALTIVNNNTPIWKGMAKAVNTSQPTLQPRLM
jgi:hypothetical protein